MPIFLPAERTYLATLPQHTPEVVGELLEHFMGPVHSSNAKRRAHIGKCCLHVDDLFIIGTPEFLETFWKKVRSNFKIGHEDVNDLLLTGQRVKWQIDGKTKKKSHIVVEQSRVSELTEIAIQRRQYCISFNPWKHKLVAITSTVSSMLPIFSLCFSSSKSYNRRL